MSILFGVVIMLVVSKKESLIVKLQERVSLLEKAMNLLLFGEYVEIAEAEKKEILSRLMDYIEGKEEEFIGLEELENIVQDKNTQKGS